MPALPATLVALVLFVSAPASAWSGPPPLETGGGRQLILPSDTLGRTHEVRIGPDTSINLFFDAPVQLVGLEAREHFRRVAVTEDSILLMASRELEPGRRLRMPVRFMDGVAPARVDFILVVVAPDQSERQVEVFRPRGPERCLVESRVEREMLRQCQAELERERAVPARLGGLTGLLAQAQMDGQGVVARALRLIQSDGQSLWVGETTSYRATRPMKEGEGENPRVVRVAVELWMVNEGTEPWTAVGSELVAGDGARFELSVWQEAPLVPDSRRRRVVVEAEMMEAEARGIFTLELWEEGRTRSIIFGGVSFP